MQQLLRRCIPVIARYRDRAPRFSPEALARLRQQPRRAPWGSEGSGRPSGRKSDGQETIYPSRVDSDNDIPPIADESLPRGTERELRLSRGSAARLFGEIENRGLE